MSTRIAQLSTDPTLTGYIQGVGEQSKSATARFISPDVPVPTAMGSYKIWGAKEKLVIPDTRRPLSGDGTFIDMSMGGGTFNCAPHALNVAVDFTEETELKTITSLIKTKARTAGSLAGMAHEKRVLDKAIGGATAGDTIDTTSTAVDVIKIINAHLLDVIKGAKGWGADMELRILFGALALAKIASHVSVLNRYKNSGKKEGFVSPTVTDIAQMLMLAAQAQVSLMVQDANINKDAASVDFMLGSKILIFACVPNPTDYDTSFMKTFRMDGEFMTPRYWTSASGRQNNAGFDWSEDNQIANADASRLCDVT